MYHLANAVVHLIAIKVSQIIACAIAKALKMVFGLT